MSDDISIKWSGGERTFGPDATVTIGRDPSCDVVIDNPRVSRQHAELRHSSTGWLFVDPSSSRGSFIGSSRVGEQAVDRSITIRLGGETEGESIDLILPERTQFASPPPTSPDASNGASSGPPPPPRPSPPTPAPTPAPPVPVAAAAPGGDVDRPGGSLRAEPLAATVVTGQSISIQCAGKSYSFQPGKEVIIGRDPASDIQVDNPVVSRRHAAIRSTGGGWELADFGSSSGTFVDGERITTKRLSGSMAIYLGPEDVGERMVVVTAGPTVPGRRRRSGSGSRSGGKAVLAGLIIALVAVVIAVVALVTRDNGTSGPDLAKLREGTVEIFTPDSQGSGTVISNDGLILTNAHVAAPDALGRGVLTDLTAAELKPSPPEVKISVLHGNSTEPAYVGRVVAADGYLDLAVVRITSTVGGTIVHPGDDLGLQPVKIGDSSKLESGDPLYVIGYPGIANTNDATVSDGTVGSFLADARLNSNQAWINTDANIAGGNSGGLAADKSGSLIGTPTQVKSEDRTNSAIGRIRPVQLAMPLIDAAKNGTPYTSPYVLPKGEATIPDYRYVVPSADPGFTLGCERAQDTGIPSSLSSQIAVRFSYDKFPVDTNQDVLAIARQGETEVGRWTSASQWPFKWGNGKGCAVINLPLKAPLGLATTTVTFYVGGNYESVASFTVVPA